MTPMQEISKQGEAITILLVEDEDVVREAAHEVLQSCGYRVLKARDASEATELFEACARSIRLLIADVILPTKKGGELAQDLHALCPGLRTILMSGYPQTAVMPRNAGDGTTVFLAKPFSLESLMREVLEAGELQHRTKLVRLIPEMAYQTRLC